MIDQELPQACSNLPDCMPISWLKKTGFGWGTSGLPHTCSKCGTYFHKPGLFLSECDGIDKKKITTAALKRDMVGAFGMLTKVRGCSQPHPRWANCFPQTSSITTYHHHPSPTFIHHHPPSPTTTDHHRPSPVIAKHLYLKCPYMT